MSSIAYKVVPTESRKTPVASAAREEISILTAVFNHESTLAETIESVLMQETRYTYHLYCFNDASTDASAEILEAYRSRYPDRITVFTSTQNQGSGKMSFLHHRPPILGRYWCLLAGDDYWTTRDKLDRQVELLACNPAAVGCSTHTVMHDERNGKKSVIAPRLQRWNLMDLLATRDSLYVHPSGILWRNIHLHTGSFLPPKYRRSDIAGDTALTHMMLEGGGEMVNLAEVASCYRVTGRGVWSRLTQAEKDERNMKLHEYIRMQLPLRYRLACKFQQSKKLEILARFLLLPSPVGIGERMNAESKLENKKHDSTQ
jgi:glycosyltransferase involved in cell wall biosynthesis